MGYGYTEHNGDARDENDRVTMLEDMILCRLDQIERLIHAVDTDILAIRRLIILADEARNAAPRPVDSVRESNGDKK